MAMLPNNIKKLQKRISHICILLLIGLFVSAQQVSSESVFDRTDDFSLHENKLGSPVFTSAAPEAYGSAHADTMEVYDIEIPEEEERNIYKEVAVYVLVVAAVGYFVYTLIKPDDEEVVDDGGKEPPFPLSVSFSIPFSR